MLFFLLLSEFLLNRTLNRFWIFVPQNPFTHSLFLAIQWGGYIAMIALYVLAFAYLGLWGSLPLALVALVVTALDLSAAYIGVGLRLMPLLPLVYALFFRSRAGYVVAAYYLAQGVVNLYVPQLLWATPYLEWAWAFMPLVGVFISGVRPGAWKLASAAALAAAAAVAASPYYMGMILVFGMGLTQPWLLPLAVFLSLLPRERLFVYSLLVGPQVQLSVHYLTLATATGYVARGKFKGGAVGPTPPPPQVPPWAGHWFPASIRCHICHLRGSRGGRTPPMSQARGRPPRRQRIREQTRGFKLITRRKEHQRVASHATCYHNRRL